MAEAPWAGLIGAVLLLVSVILISTGELPLDLALAVLDRTWPILVFVVAATLVAELADQAGVFSAAAQGLAGFATGRAWSIWLLMAALAVASTVFLSLDTTAVLLTPVVILLARALGIDPRPLALTTVWIANTGSLLFPVSNLTNLLAAHILGLGPWEFAALMAPAAVVSIVVPLAVVAVFYRGVLSVELTRIVPTRPEDPWLTRAAAVVVVALLPALVSGVPVWIPALAAAVILTVLVLVRRPRALTWSMFPWQIAVLATGLFLVAEAVHAGPTAAALAALAGTGDSLFDLWRLAGAGVLLANGLNNLPAYLLLEPLSTQPVRMAAMLVGVNAGALATPWASLAILLWHARLDALGVEIRWGRYIAASAVVVILTVPTAVAAVAWFST